ncbi:MAG: PaaI family thioesterase [Betaproteobacteria bacterium]|nr:PaaI family thioesterase [Betaproteobacteria bacterium]
MTHTVRPPSRTFETRNPDWEATVRESFARQGVMTLIGADMGVLAPGHCEIRLPYREDLTQQNGFFHAGITATIVDSAGGYAGLTLMPAGAEVLTVEFKLNLLAPADGEFLLAEGKVLKSGRNLVIARGEVYAIKNGHATHCATMQQTLMTMHGRS